MKFKSLFLCMLGAAVFVGCNNEIDNGGGDPNINPEGISTYATFSLNFPGASTYAGTETIPSEAVEKNVIDAAMYVYKWDGANTTAEAMAYVAENNLGNPRTVTMMVKNGIKKIFVAVNIGNTTTPLLDNNSGSFTYALYPDTGVDYTSQFTALNQILAATSSGFSRAAAISHPTTTVLGEFKADPLIRTLAGGAKTTASGVIASTGTFGSDAAFLMTNWDGPSDNNPAPNGIYTSDCLFTLQPNISAAASKLTTSDNYIVVGVQRAVAKVSFRVTANGATVNNSATYTGPYLSSENDGSKGQFTPWVDGSSRNIWSLGGINKRMTPFQVFAGSNNAVASPNYTLATGDTVHFTAIANLTVDNLSANWYGSYDNTRVFGTGQRYGTRGATVSIVKTAMATAGNNLHFSTANATGQTSAPFVTAFAPENGTEFPQWKAKGTYAVMGGLYKPENVLTGIQNPSVTTNPAEKGWNGVAPVVNQANSGLGTNPYMTLNYTGVGMDTLYYLTGAKVFIHGTDNLQKYYAWELKHDKDNATPSSSAIVAQKINEAAAANMLLAYFQGQCFYRVWIRDTGAANYEDEYLVRRNHVYDINITKIKGPGIADPNNIIGPGVIPDLDTFVTAEIKILDWHKVTTTYDVSYD